MKRNDDIILNCVIVILIAKNILQNSMYIQIPNIIEVGIEAISYAYFAISIIKYLKVKKWKIVVIFGIVLATFYTGYITKNMTLLSSVMFMTITAIIQSEKIIKTSNKVVGYILFSHIIIYLIQLFTGRVKPNIETDGRIRYLLGFQHANTSGILLLWWVTGKIYLSNYNMKKVLFYTAMIIIFYYFNRCRSMLYCMFILLIVSICINKKDAIKIIKFFARNIILIMAISIIILINLYNRGNNSVQKIDELLSGRIFFSAQAIKDNGFTILGQNVKNTIVTKGYYVGYIVMDVTYTALCYKYGILYLVLLILLSHYITKTYSEKEYSLLIVYGAFALLELYSLNFIVCFPMLFGGKWIGERNDT